MSKRAVIAVWLAMCSAVLAERRVDCWWEEPALVMALDSAGKAVDVTRRTRQTPAPVELDYADKRAGDCSLRYIAPAGKELLRIGLTPGACQPSWKLGPQWSLHLWLKCQSPQVDADWSVLLVDASGRKAQAPLAGFAGDGQWREYTLPLKQMKAEAGFDFSQIGSIQFSTPLAPAGTLWMDDVYWSDGKAEIGVTDKTISQRMAEEKASRRQRVREAFEKGAQVGEKSPDRQAYDQLFVGQDVQGANRVLRDWYRQELENCRNGVANLWALSWNTRMIQAYWRLGSKSELKRLEPETEKLLLELLWERTKEKNDIALTRWSTWWMVGSENHDLNAKASNLLTSRIFMNEPEYASRVYPDLGHGDGHGYWFHDKVGGKRGLGPPGRANLKDGKAYTAKDHYEAWLRHMKEYFAERAKKGFFLERAASGYSKYTLSFVQIIHDYCGDEQLKRQAAQFLDLYWTDWAQEQIGGMRGGPKTRWHGAFSGQDSCTYIARFYLGGPMLSTNLTVSTFLVSDYAWPRWVWELALDREALGSYACISRGVGEEETTYPRPPGTERSMLGNCESRFVKYSWVTPDYILGTQMDHPAAVYNHLAVSRRWQGLIVGTSPDAYVVVSSAGAPKDMSLVYHAVQDRQVLMTQQARRWTQISPDWFPSSDIYSQPVEVYLGQWDKVQEQDGWVFLQKGNVYAAIRVVDGQKGALLAPGRRADVTPGENEAGAEPVPATASASVPANDNVALSVNTYEWNESRTSLKLLDKYNPVIVEAGRRVDFPTLADFQKAILANPLKLIKTAVPGYYIVSYRGCGPQAKELVYNAATPGIPMIGGEYVDHSPAKVFDSPFIQSDYNSGIVIFRKGEEQRSLDFNQPLK